jgi:uncharacterized Tic20 family protein
MTEQELTSDERNWAMWAHLCGLFWLFEGAVLLFHPIAPFALFTILGPLIIWRSKRDTMPFATAQAKESLNFQITMWLLGSVLTVLALMLIGPVLLWILGLVNIALVIIAAIQVHDGKPYRYPLCLRLID